MELFIDIVLPSGSYHGAARASWVDGASATAVFSCAQFLGALGIRQDTAQSRLFHVEANIMLPMCALADTEVHEGDTVVIIASDDALFDDPNVIQALWAVTGGPGRRQRRLLRELDGVESHG